MVEAKALPPLVRRYLERAVPSGVHGIERVRLTQVGQMWQKPGGRALRFTATEELSIASVEFSWRARFAAAPLVRLHVVDEYRHGSGSLEVRVLGVPVVRRRGPELDVGEAMRYLSELPWVPHAILANQQLAWRGLDETSVEVSTEVGTAKAAVVLRFDEEGLITGSFALERPRLGDGGRPTPWRGSFSAYATVGGVLVPTRAEVGWELADGPFTYWNGSVTSLEAR